MVDVTNTTTYHVYEVLLMMNEGEKFTVEDVLAVCTSGTDQNQVSAALSSLARRENPMIKAIAKIDKGKTSRRYLWVRTGHDGSDLKFRNTSKRKLGYKRVKSNPTHRLLPADLKVEVELHDGKYMTSIGW